MTSLFMGLRICELKFKTDDIGAHLDRFFYWSTYFIIHIIMKNVAAIKIVCIFEFLITDALYQTGPSRKKWLSLVLSVTYPDKIGHHWL